MGGHSSLHPFVHRFHFKQLSSLALIKSGVLLPLSRLTTQSWWQQFNLGPGNLLTIGSATWSERLPTLEPSVYPTPSLFLPQYSVCCARNRLFQKGEGCVRASMDRVAVTRHMCPLFSLEPPDTLSSMPPQVTKELEQVGYVEVLSAPSSCLAFQRGHQCLSK